MKIVCISDTHYLHAHTPVPNGDLLIHAGDVSTIGDLAEIVDFNRWLGTLPHPYKIVIAGNHDFYFEKEPQKAKELLTNAIYLNDSGIEIEGFKIWGSPISPQFHHWAFNRQRGAEIRQHWALIPADTDILITHCPPYGILDQTDTHQHEGCRDLLDIVQHQIQPCLHVFGHIHEAYGSLQIGRTLYVNASVVGLKGWIGKYEWARKLRRIAISAFQIIQQIRKKYFGTPPEKLHNKSLSKQHWQVVNKAIVVEIGAF